MAFGIIVLVRRAQFHLGHAIGMTQTSRESFLTLRIAEPLHEQLRGTAERCRQSVSEVENGHKQIPNKYGHLTAKCKQPKNKPLESLT